MKKYLPQIYSSMVSPAIKLDNNIFSLSRYLNKRAMLKQCKQLWNLQNEDELDRQIAQSYLSLKDAVQAKNYPMALRYLSPPLYDQLTQNPSVYKFQDSISDVSILNCAKTKDQSNGTEWFHISVVIKHYRSQYLYGLERRIYTQNHQFSQSFKRKWCFNQLPLRQDPNTNK